jgi:hypothetical protein
MTQSARHQWLTSVITATTETEGLHFEANSMRSPSQQKKLGMVTVGNKKQDHISKITRAKRAGGMAQIVEPPASSSTPSTAKNKIRYQVQSKCFRNQTPETKYNFSCKGGSNLLESRNKSLVLQKFLAHPRRVMPRQTLTT